MYKNLLQETAHRAGLKLPVYTTVRSGPGHIPVFTSSVELAGMSFSGEAAKTKKQAEKNAAIAAWSALKRSKKNVLTFLFFFILFVSFVAFFSLYKQIGISLLQCRIWGWSFNAKIIKKMVLRNGAVVGA